MAFHVLNAWEDKVETQGPDGRAATTQSVLKVVTCNLFEIDMDDLEEHKSTGGKTGARGTGNGGGGGGWRGNGGLPHLHT